MAQLHNAIGTKGLFTDGDWILSDNMDKAGTIGVIQLKHVGVGEFLRKDFQFISEKTFRDLGCTEVLPGDVLISRMADPIARACIVPRLPFRLVTAVDVSILRVDEQTADPLFISYLCNSPVVRDQAETAGRGTTRSRITRTELETLEIPLPDLSEQKRIARLLGKADQLRRTRHYALELSDAFLPAVFRELFGDPINNDKGWHVTALGDYIDFLTSGSRGWASYYAERGDVFIRIQNVGRGRMLLDDLTYVVAPRNAEATRTSVKSGDVLLSITADLGRSAAIPDGFPPAYVNQHLAIIRQTELNPVFLATLLSCDAAQAKWGTIDRAAVKSGLNFDDIRGFHVIAPPMPSQQHFAGLVARHERLKAGQREALRQADHLFHSLLHRAFVGTI